MTYSIEHHTRGYGISASDAFFSLATGLSGAPIAKRHFQVANTDADHYWGHKLISAIEFIPIIGALVALIERVVVYLFYQMPDHIHWKPRLISKERAMQKMYKNARKAINEHLPKSRFFATEKEALPPLQKLMKPKIKKPLKLTCYAADDIGTRPAMEDAHCFRKMKGGFLAAVFDGHKRKIAKAKGDTVARYASDQFYHRFPKELIKANGNVHQAFESLIHQIHLEITQKPEWDHIGSTAVICYIDTKTDLIYTANLGDSEANIYRKIGNILKSIPLSCIRHWKSSKDLARLIKAYHLPHLAQMWKNRNPKDCRSQISRGVNMPRAFGDRAEAGTRGKPIMIHKPKITVNKIKPGDILILACDGLDYISVEMIIRLLNSMGFTSKLAEQLVRLARLNMKPATKERPYPIGDNITVLAIQAS